MARYKPVKLGYELIEPKFGSDDRLSPLLFLHGVTSSKEVTWGNLPQTIADQTKRKTYNLDARNHGDSEWSAEFDYDLNVEDLLHFIDERGFPKVVIVGHSMGGRTGIKAALKAPERIEMLFAEDVGVKTYSQSLRSDNISNMIKWREAEKFIPSGVDKEDAENFITDYILRQRFPDRPASDYRETRYGISYPLKKDSSGRYVFQTNLEVMIEMLKNDSLMAENEGVYEGPSYFLYGTKSPYQVGKEKDQILKHFPKAVFKPFETYEHSVHKKFPELFVETVVKFIKENENIQ